MPCLMRRGHRNRLQNNSLKKSLKRRTLSHHSLVRKIRGKLNGKEMCMLFHQLNVAVLLRVFVFCDWPRARAFRVCSDVECVSECVRARDNNHI